MDAADRRRYVTLRDIFPILGCQHLIFVGSSFFKGSKNVCVAWSNRVIEANRTLHYFYC